MAENLVGWSATRGGDTPAWQMIKTLGSVLRTLYIYSIGWMIFLCGHRNKFIMVKDR
jgi:hypothetical protein